MTEQWMPLVSGFVAACQTGWRHDTFHAGRLRYGASASLHPHRLQRYFTCKSLIVLPSSQLQSYQEYIKRCLKLANFCHDPRMGMCRFDSDSWRLGFYVVFQVVFIDTVRDEGLGIGENCRLRRPGQAPFWSLAMHVGYRMWSGHSIQFLTVDRPVRRRRSQVFQALGACAP